MSTEDRGEVPHVGQLIRHDREQAGIARRDLADVVGISPSHLRNVENGHRPVTAAIAAALAAALGTDPDRYGRHL